MSNENMTPSAPQAPVSESAPQIQNVDQLAQAIDAKKSPQAPLIPEPIKQEAKRLKQLQLKVYGETVTEDLPFEIDDNPEVVEYLTKQLQLGKAAQRAMQEKGSFEKQVQSFVENLKGNTAQVLQQMGIDPIEFAAKQLEAEIEKQKLSPAERKNLEYEEKLKKLLEQ